VSSISLHSMATRKRLLECAMAMAHLATYISHYPWCSKTVVLWHSLRYFVRSCDACGLCCRQYGYGIATIVRPAGNVLVLRQLIVCVVAMYSPNLRNIMPVTHTHQTSVPRGVSRLFCCDKCRFAQTIQHYHQLLTRQTSLPHVVEMIQD
jgi:hypothetical protein